MDANFFRFVIKEGRKYLQDVRIEKVYSPDKDLWTFKLSSKTNLIFHHSSKNNFLFFSKEKPENPSVPPPIVGWWRKRVQNKKIVSIVDDWAKRKLYLEIENREDGNFWILFDLKKGLFLEPPPEKEEVIWPELEEIIEDKEIYKKYPHITSPLRYSLISLRDDKKEFYSKLISGDIQDFYVYEKIDGKDILLSLCQREDFKGYEEKIFPSAIAAASYYGWFLINKFKGRDKGTNKREKRLKKRIESQRKKLKNWVSLGEKADLIKAHLHLFDGNRHYTYVEIPMENGEMVKIELDPSMSLIENINFMYRRAKKGKRGLVYLDQKSNNEERENKTKALWKNQEKEIINKKIPLPSRLKGLDIRVYKSSDDFYMVRGKNQRANHKLLSYGARAHDLWFHVQDGPGAHVVIIRDNPRKEVPPMTIEEAAILAGLASYQKNSEYAYIMGTEVRYVRKKKNMALGEVEVTEVLYSLKVKLDPLLEEKLRIY